MRGTPRTRVSHLLTSPDHPPGVHPGTRAYSSCEGVDLGAVVIGHSGDTSDPDYLHQLIDNGSYLGMDRFGEQIAPNWHYTHLHDHVLPALLQAGVTQAQLDTMLVDNPRRYFSPAKS
ncbi:hypothetical protein ACFRH4_35150 [Streptomyces mirabilis]|uniref:phosphotriesterase family protein n=1 Tax=Streptomyces mirabilis TaxID=68239 RepID=UPI00368AB0FC